jgi:cellulose synthase/poly-beta-1,6-N-acetylglucosamine synthase-like glycosyltransferase
MALRREALGKVNWSTASPVEDAEYDSQLCAAGVRVRFCREAVVWCEAPAAVNLLCRQRRRWSLAGPIAGKPMVLAHLFATLCVCGMANVFTWWAGGLVLGTAFIYLKAMHEVGFTRHRLGLLLTSPFVVLRLIGVAISGLLPLRTVSWERTPRLGEG